MGKSTISMAIFKSYVRLPEGKLNPLYTYIYVYHKHPETIVDGQPWQINPLGYLGGTTL